MGRNRVKRQHTAGPTPSSRSKISKSKHPPNPPSNKAKHSGLAKQKASTTVRHQQLCPLPLDPDSKILLIGEGDFSFAASLATHHGCKNLIATSYDSAATLQLKHPITCAENIAAIASASPTNQILYSVDGTKLGLPSVPGGAELRKLVGTFESVWFNFPHVGGKSTDVNRQVRANQALVVGFLEGALRMVRAGGAVVVSLFEGMPYELWGIRNLARHVGLTVERSATFEWERFPGYSHKRTFGDVDGGGGWKGEQRDARIYIFRKPGGPVISNQKKRKRNDSDDSEDEDD